MNNNFINRTNPKRNSLLSFVFTLIAYAGQLGVDYFMGKAIDVWLSSNSGILENLLKWILDNPVPFTIIIFFSSLLLLMLYDYKRSTELEAKSPVTGSTSYMSQSHTGIGDVVGGDKVSGDKVSGDKIVIEKDTKPKLPGIELYPRWCNRNLSVKKGSLQQVVVCIEHGIKTCFWNHRDEEVWYEVDSSRSEFYSPQTHNTDVNGYVVHGIKNNIVIKDGGIISKVLGSEEKLDRLFTILVEDAGFNEKVRIHVRLDSDYLYGELFFEDVHKALEGKFGKKNVEVLPA